MKKILTMACMATALVACSDDAADNKTAAVVPTQTAAPQADILNYIPSNTPLLALSGLSSDQYPARYIETMETYMSHMGDYMQTMIDQGLEAAMQKGEDDANTVEQKVKPFVGKWFADGNMSKLGFKINQSQLAMYTVDLFPVMRIKLSTGHQMEALLSEAQTEFDIPFTASEINGMKVRELAADQATVMIGLNNDYLVVSLAPTPIKDQMVNALMGFDKPATSLAQDNSIITQVKSKYGFTLNDMFIVDMAAAADYFINPSKHDSALLNFLHIEDNMLSADCKTEFTDLSHKMPRMIAGSTGITDTNINTQFILETDAEIGSDLSTLAGRVPASNKQSAFAFGMSFDLLAAKEIAGKYVQRLVDQPYKCEQLVQINQNAAQMQAQLNQPIPPFVGNFKGFSFSLDDLKLNPAAVDSGQPDQVVESFKAQVLLAVDEAQGMLGMAQMMVPQLAEVKLNTDGSLVHLADKLPVSGKDIPFDAEHFYGALTESTVGLSIGHPEGGGLSDLVKSEGANKLMTFSASGDGYKRIMEQVFAMAEMPGMPEDIKKELMFQKDMTMNMIYWKDAKGSMNFTDKGLVIDSTMTF